MKDDGGQAFAGPAHKGMDGAWHNGQPGMSLRDWFAGQALVGILAYPDPGGTVKTMAGIAYEYADAMLEARKK